MTDAMEIYQTVLAQCTEQIDKLKNEINRLQKQNDNMTKRMDKLEILVQKQNIEKNVFSRPQKQDKNCTDKIELDRIKGYAYEYDGWLYYANEKMGEFLYRVRTDGTGNEQLTDYSVRMMSVSKIKNGKLYFCDKDFNEHSIKIENGKAYICDEDYNEGLIRL